MSEEMLNNVPCDIKESTIDNFVENTLDAMQDFLTEHEDFKSKGSLILLNYSDEKNNEKFRFVSNLEPESFVIFFYEFFKDNQSLWNSLFYNMLLNSIKESKEKLDSLNNTLMEDVCKTVKF